VVVDGGELPGQADTVADLRRVAGDVVPGYPRRAGVGPQQGGEDADQGGLSRAVGTEQSVDDALRDGQAQPFQRPGAVAELSGHLVHRDDRVAHEALPVC